MVSSSSLNLIGAPPSEKLTRANYLVWKAHVLLDLHSARLLRVVEAPGGTPGAPEDPPR